MKGIISILFLNVLLCNITFCYPWPVSDFNSQHPVKATLGEYRQEWRSHDGIDIGHSIGIEIYPVVSGTVSAVQRIGANDDYVTIIGNDGILYSYLHITPDHRIRKDSTVTVGVTLLGIVKELTGGLRPHLHFKENGGGLNPLRTGGLAPEATQWIDPVVFKPEFRRDGTLGETAIYYTQRINGRIYIYGKINIITRAYERFDEQNGGSENCGVYKMDYLLASESGNYFGPFESFRFDALYPDRPVPNIFAKDPNR